MTSKFELTFCGSTQSGFHASLCWGWHITMLKLVIMTLFSFSTICRSQLCRGAMHVEAVKCQALTQSHLMQFDETICHPCDYFSTLELPTLQSSSIVECCSRWKSICSRFRRKKCSIIQNMDETESLDSTRHGDGVKNIAKHSIDFSWLLLAVECWPKEQSDSLSARLVY